MDGNTFITVNYQGRDSWGTFRILWNRPDLVVITVRPAGGNPEDDFEATLTGLPPSVNQVQAMLAGAGDASLGDRVDFSVQTKRDGRATHSKWSGDTETENLRRLRQALEEIGHLHFVAAKAYLARGRKRKADNLAGGIEDFRAGLTILGDRYFDPARVDDTGMKLVAADAKQKSGQLDIAANIYERVLDDRIGIYTAHKLGPVTLTAP